MFDLGNDYFSGYLSDTEITDIDGKYIGTMIDAEALTKISRQLTVSMGSMMGLVNGFAMLMFMVLVYLLSKIIIEKNAQSISMTKILGYSNREISGLYIMSTTIVVILFLLISLPIEYEVMVVLFRMMMLQSISGWITFYIGPEIYVEMFVMGFANLPGGGPSGIPEDPACAHGRGPEECGITGRSEKYERKEIAAGEAEDCF